MRSQREKESTMIASDISYLLRAHEGQNCRMNIAGVFFLAVVVKSKIKSGGGSQVANLYDVCRDERWPTTAVWRLRTYIHYSLCAAQYLSAMCNIECVWFYFYSLTRHGIAMIWIHTNGHIISGNSSTLAFRIEARSIQTHLIPSSDVKIYNILILLGPLKVLKQLTRLRTKSWY